MTINSINGANNYINQNYSSTGNSQYINTSSNMISNPAISDLSDVLKNAIQSNSNDEARKRKQRQKDILDLGNQFRSMASELSLLDADNPENKDRIELLAKQLKDLGEKLKTLMDENKADEELQRLQAEYRYLNEVLNEKFELTI